MFNSFPIEELREHFSYSPADGNVLRIKRFANDPAAPLNCPVGYRRKDGYIGVEIKERQYLLHRVIWAIHTGAWPAAFIDHRDGIRDNNRWENLREATREENHQNKSLYSNNKTGVTGVYWEKRYCYYTAHIRLAGKKYYLGSFPTIREAAVARAKAKVRLHEFQPVEREPVVVLAQEFT